MGTILDRHLTMTSQADLTGLVPADLKKNEHVRPSCGYAYGYVAGVLSYACVCAYAV